MHNEELHNSHTSSNIIWVIKLIWTRLVGSVARMGGMKRFSVKDFGQKTYMRG